jgi:hypothetical protein
LCSQRAACPSQINQAVFHYNPAAEDGRWELGISTPLQRELAWRYGHARFVIMDGTFDLCSKAVLCFIVLVVDEDNHGLPVAYLLMTPRNRVSRSTSDYNSAVLENMLRAWSCAITQRRVDLCPTETASFTPKVCWRGQGRGGSSGRVWGPVRTV